MNLFLLKHCCLSITFIVISFVLASVQILSIVLLIVEIEGIANSVGWITVMIMGIAVVILLLTWGHQ